MDSGDLRPADAPAFEAAQVEHLPGGMARRILEDAAGARDAHGLMLGLGAGVAVDQARYQFRAARDQVKLDLGDDPPRKS